MRQESMSLFGTDDTPPVGLTSRRIPAQAGRPLAAAVLCPGAEEGRLPERGGHSVRQWRLLVAGAVARQPDWRLPKRLMFGEFAGGEDPGRGNPEQDWLIYLKDDLQVFGATHGSTADQPCVFGIPKLD